MTPVSACRQILLGVVCLVGPTAPSHGEIAVDQVAIIANRNSPDSLAIASHYAKRRGVPDGHIIPLDLPVTETLNRTDYETRLVLPLRQWLETNHLARTVRLLVTTYGVPLRVEAPDATREERRWLKDAGTRQRFARTHLTTIIQSAGRVAEPRGEPGSPDASTPPSTETERVSTEDRVLLEQVHQAIRAAAVRIQQSAGRAQKDQIRGWTDTLGRLVVQAGGRAALVHNLQAEVPADSPPSGSAELEKLARQIASGEQIVRVLTETPSDVNRKRAYYLAERLFGLQGVLRLATAERDSFSYQDGDAAVDSELSLLWWDRGTYRVSGRMPNPYYYQTPTWAEQTAMPIPTMLVGRLDAPTPDRARELVEQALEAEQHGLRGTVYIDARGLKPDGTMGYGDYDQGLRDLSTLIRTRTSYPVVLDDTERRFSQPGEAPDVAIYVGWYKLRSYEDAFRFNPGAIGYHIASAEAISIHDPKETGWCKNALERGITVTLGSTGEPYVDAFPLPSQFFPLLLTGRYSLVEAYALTSRWVSWRMALFGDPLYNPWRGRGLLTDKEAVLHTLRAHQHDRLPPALLPLPFSDPIRGRETFKQQRGQVLAQVAKLMEELERQDRPRARQ